MAKLTWAVACRRIIHDSPTGLFSYLDSVDGMTTPQFPIEAPPLFVGTLWERDPGEASITMRVRIYGVDGSHLMDAPAAVLNFEAQHKKGRINLGFGGFSISGPGTIHLGIEHKVKRSWVEVHRIPLEIEQGQAAVVPPPA